MNTAIDTVIIIHVPSEWRTTNRRWAFRALADTLPNHAAVLCVNRPVDLAVTPAKRPRKFWRGVWASQLEMENDRFGVLTPRLVLHEMLAKRVPGATRVNRRLMASQLRQALKSAYPNARRFIQWIHHPNQRWVFGALPNCGKVYHAYDEYTCKPNGEFNHDRWVAEQRVLRDADVTFVTSQSLMDRRSPIARRIHMLPNGVPDFFLSSSAVDSDPIDEIPAPRIFYVGSMYDFLDYTMLKSVFERHPDWQLIMIGRTRNLPGERALAALGNVNFIGVRQQEGLPGILNRFSVGLIPFRINQYSAPATPLKLFMYFAAGIPVVSTRLPNLKPWDSLINLVDDDVGAFENAIMRLLSADQSALRTRLRTEARNHTWSVINRKVVIPALSDAFGPLDT